MFRKTATKIGLSLNNGKYLPGGEHYPFWSFQGTKITSEKNPETAKPPTDHFIPVSAGSDNGQKSAPLQREGALFSLFKSFRPTKARLNFRQIPLEVRLHCCWEDLRKCCWRSQSDTTSASKVIGRLRFCGATIFGVKWASWFNFVWVHELFYETMLEEVESTWSFQQICFWILCQ